MKRVSSIIWGVVLIAAGVIFGLNAMNIIDVDIFFDGWWTLLIIVPCGVGLITDSDKWGSAVGLGIGVFLLLCCQDILSFSMFWKLIVPVVIVAVGLKLVFSSFLPRSDVKDMEIKRSSDGYRQTTAAFAGSELNFSGEPFESTELNAFFGGVDCDIRNAIIESDCVINATAMFGGITIYAPQNMSVKIRSTSLFGGTGDKLKRSGINSEHTLYVNAKCLFGGVEIK